MRSGKHIDSAAMESFMAKPLSSQLLEIWINSVETNGAIADAQRELAAQGLEIQKARMDLSEHIKPHVTAEELKLLRSVGSFSQLIKERQTMMGRVNTMWGAFTAGRRILIIGGGVLAFLAAIQPLEIWLLTKYFG